MKKRIAVASVMLSLDEYWTKTFGDIGLHDINFSDLFFQMWLRADTPLTKTSLYDFMPGISRRTAVKYVQELIDRELLSEAYAAEDRRVKYVSLSAEVEGRLEKYLDFAYNGLKSL